jgi:hypothetical protein
MKKNQQQGIGGGRGRGNASNEPYSTRRAKMLFTVLHIDVVVLVSDVTGVCEFSALVPLLVVISRTIWELALAVFWVFVTVILQSFSLASGTFDTVLLASTSGKVSLNDLSGLEAYLESVGVSETLVLVLVLSAPLMFLAMMCYSIRSLFRKGQSGYRENSDEQFPQERDLQKDVPALNVAATLVAATRVTPVAATPAAVIDKNNNVDDDDDDDLLLCGVDFSSIATGEVQDDEEVHVETEAKRAEAEALAKAKADKEKLSQRRAAAILLRHRRKNIVEFDDVLEYRPLMGLPPSPPPTHETGKAEGEDPSLLSPLPLLEPPYRPASLDNSKKALQAKFVELFQWAENKGAVLENVEWGQDPWGGNGLFVKNRPVSSCLQASPWRLWLG